MGMLNDCLPDCLPICLPVRLFLGRVFVYMLTVDWLPF